MAEIYLEVEILGTFFHFLDSKWPQSGRLEVIMKYKKIVSIFALCVVALCLSTNTVHAAPQSEISIEFEEGNEIVEPVDPDNPTIPLEPPGTGTGESGPLTLNYVSPLNFGTQQVSSTLKVYSTLTMRPFIQVTDLRGTGVGWSVRAKVSPFLNNLAAPSLPGATIDIVAGEAISANADLLPPAPATNVHLLTDGAIDTDRDVVTANTDEGMGTWVIRWYPITPSPDLNDNITLSILGGTAAAGTHTATITWSLIAAP